MDDGDFAGLGGVDEPSVTEILRDVRFDANKTMTSQIFEVIRRLIITVTLLPGQKISENEISEALNASKTPVREALIRLEDAGLVAIVPKSGTFVAPIRIDRYIDACFIRLQLETGAVRRAAKRFRVISFMCIPNSLNVLRRGVWNLVADQSRLCR